MNDKDIEKSAEDKTAGSSLPRKKSSSKISTDEQDKSTKNGEKKKKAPKIPKTDSEKIDEVNNNHNDDTQATSAADQEVPVKPKKKKAPKIEVNNENAEPIPTDQPIKKKKPKAPKIPPPPAADDGFQIADNPAIDELEPYSEPKPKQKKPKKSKSKVTGSFEELQVTNLDDTYSTNQELDINTNGDIPDYSDDMFQEPSENVASDYEKAIVDIYKNLQSKVNFGQYVGDDQWCIVRLPKTARVEPKSRLRKMLPGGSKEDKSTTKSSTGKPAVPKEKLLKRFRTSVNSLVRDPNNLIFGERSNYEMGEEEDDPDGVDTDDLHRYAQRLRELEDQDREINPEFLVLRDGKTVYGVHESDLDGKVKLSTRKPIYDRYADQTPEEQTEKRKLLARLKHPFTRSKDKDDKDSKSANATPDPRADRKSGQKSLSEELPPPPPADDSMLV